MIKKVIYLFVIASLFWGVSYFSFKKDEKKTHFLTPGFYIEEILEKNSGQVDEMIVFAQDKITKRSTKG